MRFRTLVLFLVLFFAFSQVAGKTAKAATNQLPVPTPATSGEEMFATYCAECHGRDGRGFVQARKVVAPDLTTLSQKNHGRFPYGVVRDSIRGEYHGAVYGAREMPPWGELFQYVGSGSEGEIRVRVEKLTEFVRSIQRK
ncbi:MAG TPA: c-type cytochrome [Bryobacteraceae bacterium]|nr:c-type cytochrome [Bryobacteraceae bacterium]